MRYVFIVNPKAGTKNRTGEVQKIAGEFFADTEHVFKVYQTRAGGHATEIARNECQRGDPVRIYGFGGDGTLLEIVRGAEGKSNAEVGIFPVGSGNDYVRTYGEKEQFLDFEKQIRGRSLCVDMIDTLGGSAVNICSVGLDARVAYEMVHYKTLPGIGGSLAYQLSLAKCLMGRIGDELTVKMKTVEGEKQLQGTYLFVLAASGRWYGGGFMGAPKAVTNDGLLDFVLIKKPPLHKIPKLVGFYKRGMHLEDPLFKGMVTFCRGTQIEISCPQDIYCNRDGECEKLKSETFSLSKGSLRFILPEGVEYGIKPIKTQRLTIRNWREEDFDDYYAYAQDPDVMLPAGNMPTADSAVARTLFQRRYLGDPLAFAIELTKEKKVIGFIGLQPDFRRFHVNSKCVGYELNKNYWGQGYVPEALRAVTRFAFTELQLEALSVFHFAVNDKSRRVIEKCGFVCEGTLRKGFRRHDGKLFDDVLYSLTREEFFERAE